MGQETDASKAAGPVSDAEVHVHVQELIAAINGRKAGDNKQWVAVVGVGTFLLLAIVPWMMVMIQKLVYDIVPANTQALVKMESQQEDVESVLRDVHDQLQLNRQTAEALRTVVKEKDEEPK